MMNEKYQEYKYDSCTSRGICSVNPKTSSMQEILILYLKLAAYYLIKLSEHSDADEKMRNLILNTISVIVSGVELSEADFSSLVKTFNKEIPFVIKKYEQFCFEHNLKPNYVKTVLRLDKRTDIIRSIRLGEKEFNKKNRLMSSSAYALYKIMFSIAKSICLNVLELEGYGFSENRGFMSILELLNMMNNEAMSEEDLSKSIIDYANKNHSLTEKIRSLQIERYGAQSSKELEYSTYKGKAILVVGSNIRELETILEEVKSRKIDVYTHDEMMLAHTFPKFSEYKHLKGQYGHGTEGCLLDFSTFPGPIVLTKHSLHNVDNLYRGQLYTTDIISSKGVIPIRGDFSKVITAAENSRGFKKGKSCETETIGFSYDELWGEIKDRISTQKYSRVFVIGLIGTSPAQKEYFERMLQRVPQEVLVISFTCCETDRSNVLCINSGYDSFIVSKITNDISEHTRLPINLFYPECGRHSISSMIYFSQKPNVSVHVGKCAPMIFNPNVLKILTKMFNIYQQTSVKNDLSKILEQ